MTWTYHESKKDDAEFLRQFIAFLQSCIRQKNKEYVRPEFVPESVEVKESIRVDSAAGVLSPGVYTVICNQWGAMFARDSIGKLMGILPDECVVLSMCPNPHLKRNQGDSK